MIEAIFIASKIGNLLASSDMQPSEVVRAWTHKAGLRANVINNGILRVDILTDASRRKAAVASIRL